MPPFDLNNIDVNNAFQNANWEYLAERFLVWVGFGTVVGLVAKAVMPGKDPGGAIATMLMGIGGAIIGGGILTYFNGPQVSPITLGGFLLAVGGAFLLLFFYRLFRGSQYMRDQERSPMPYYARRRSPRRKTIDIDSF